MSSFHKNSTLVEVFKFLDLYCINLPELWSKAIHRLEKKLPTLSIEEIIEIMTCMANQGEGEDHHYDKMEQRFEQELEYLTFKQLIQTMKIYFNLKVGSEEFMKQLISRIGNKINDQYLQLPFQELKNFMMILLYIKDDLLEQQKELFSQIEQCLLRQ